MIKGSTITVKTYRRWSSIVRSETHKMYLSTAIPQKRASPFFSHTRLSPFVPRYLHDDVPSRHRVQRKHPRQRVSPAPHPRTSFRLRATQHHPHPLRCRAKPPTTPTTTTRPLREKRREHSGGHSPPSPNVPITPLAHPPPRSPSSCPSSSRRGHGCSGRRFFGYPESAKWRHRDKQGRLPCSAAIVRNTHTHTRRREDGRTRKPREKK